MEEQELPWKNFSLEDMEDEIWKWLPGYEERYQISNMGRIKSFVGIGKPIPYIKKGTIGPSGYLQQTFSKDKKQVTLLVHILVGRCFIENPNNYPQINHKKGVKTDSRFHQLEWSNQKQNIIHAFEFGLSKIGEEHGKSKLTNKQVLEIFNWKGKRAEMSNKYNICSGTVRQIKEGKTWSEITGKYYSKSLNKTKAGFSDQDVLDIFHSTLSNIELSKKYKVSPVSISNIKIGKRWGYLTGKEYVKSRT